jgi:hypothetical protein
VDIITYARSSSSIIEDVQNLCNTRNNCVLAYFYFTFSDRKKQSFANMLRSIIAQLLSATPGAALPQEVRELYSKYGKNNRTPDIDALKSAVECMMGRFKTVFIVLDALDESDRDSREDLLVWITRIRGSGRNILVTSRNEHDIRSVLTPDTAYQISIQSSKVDADVRLYVRNCLQRVPRLKRFPKDVRNVVENKLVSGSHGMYEAPTL